MQLLVLTHTRSPLRPGTMLFLFKLQGCPLWLLAHCPPWTGGWENCFLAETARSRVASQRQKHFPGGGRGHSPLWDSPLRWAQKKPTGSSLRGSTSVAQAGCWDNVTPGSLLWGSVLLPSLAPPPNAAGAVLQLRTLENVLMPLGGLKRSLLVFGGSLPPVLGRP